MDRLFASLKWLSILALLAISVWMGCAAVADLCPQVHGPNDYCPVYHLSVSPFLTFSLPDVGVPVLRIERLTPDRDSDRDGSDYQAAGVSRAPPTLI